MGVYEPTKSSMKSCIQPSGEKLLCSAFSGCCGDKCCPDDLTFFYVCGGVAMAIVFLAVLFCCYRRRHASYRRMIDAKPEPKPKKDQPFQVVVEKDERMLIPVGQTRPSNNDVAALLNHLNGTGMEEGNQLLARV